MHPQRLLCPWNSPGKNTRVGSHSVLQGIFPTQRLNPGFLHCRQILYHLSLQGSPVNHYLLLTAEKAMAPHSSTLAWKVPWAEEPVGCSPWGHEESDTIERLHFHSSLSCIGEGNGNPLQCSCLENPRDGGAWWAAVCGVAQSRARLKRLSSSSSSRGIAMVPNYSN